MGKQPFARSESTAAHVVERRKALAELELLPCTFSPALDPHSLALVAAKNPLKLPVCQIGALLHYLKKKKKNDWWSFSGASG
ncbi:hypothetical protein ABBQ38_008435 [Trebouxia sp. C0009 RCD-2024]